MSNYELVYNGIEAKFVTDNKQEAVAKYLRLRDGYKDGSIRLQHEEYGITLFRDGVIYKRHDPLVFGNYFFSERRLSHEIMDCLSSLTGNKTPFDYKDMRFSVFCDELQFNFKEDYKVFGLNIFDALRTCEEAMRKLKLVKNKRYVDTIFDENRIEIRFICYAATIKKIQLLIE